MDILVIGGTGPTGPHIVNGLIERGHTVTILHTGNHEVDTIPAHVEHIHTDPFDEVKFRDAIQGRNFDVVFAMYGRLRSIVTVLQGRTPRLFSIGGFPVYDGFGEDTTLFPTGLAVPTAEDAPLALDARNGTKPQRIAESEALTFELHPDATHFRYPYIFGPNQVLPREWSIVKRALDGRRPLILPDGGLTLIGSSYVENATHTVLLAVDNIERSAGQIYNVSDDRQFTMAQIAQIIADELGHEFDYVSLPFDQAMPAWPVIHNHSTTHRLLDTHKARTELDYRDLVDPEIGLRRTVRWQAEHYPDDATVNDRLQDPFDYEAEDQLLAAYERFATEAAAVQYREQPGFTFGYYGPRENPGGRRGSFRS